MTFHFPVLQNLKVSGLPNLRNLPHFTNIFTANSQQPTANIDIQMLFIAASSNA